jgi:hypothetical protein
MQLGAAKNTATTEDEHLAVIRPRPPRCLPLRPRWGRSSPGATRPRRPPARSYGMNLGVAFQLIDDALDYGGATARRSGKNVGDDFREGKITLPVVLAYRRGNDEERAFWRRTLSEGVIKDGDLDRRSGSCASTSRWKTPWTAPVITAPWPRMRWRCSPPRRCGRRWKKRRRFLRRPRLLSWPCSGLDQLSSAPSSPAESTSERWSRAGCAPPRRRRPASGTGRNRSRRSRTCGPAGSPAGCNAAITSPITGNRRMAAGWRSLRPSLSSASSVSARMAEAIWKWGGAVTFCPAASPSRRRHPASRPAGRG